MSLIQMSISAAVMIFVITAIRAISINRLPKKTFIALRGLVLVRLLVPFTCLRRSASTPWQSILEQDRSAAFQSQTCCPLSRSPPRRMLYKILPRSWG